MIKRLREKYTELEMKIILMLRDKNFAMTIKQIQKSWIDEKKPAFETIDRAISILKKEGIILERKTLNKKIKDSQRNLSYIYTNPYYNDKTDSISKLLQEIYLNNYKGKPSEFAYKGFEIITLGCFGIAGLEKFSPTSVKQAAAPSSEEPAAEE